MKVWARCARVWAAMAVAAACSACGGGAGASADASTTCSVGADSLPAGGAVGDYAISAATHADNDQELYDLIDGAGDRYSSAGFLCLRSARYSSPTGAPDITVSVYDQGAPGGAAAVFDAYPAGGTPLTPTRGDASAENTSLPLNYQVYMRAGRFFVDVVADSPQSRTSALAMLDAVAANLSP